MKTADLCGSTGSTRRASTTGNSKYGGLDVSRKPSASGPSSSYHGDGNSRMPATAGTNSARMIRIQRMTAVCGGIVLISPAK